MKEGKRTDKKLPCRIHTRLTQKKYDELCSILKQSQSIHSLSELLRHILEQKTIVVKTYDTTADKIIGELAAVRKELLAIGVNINQATRALHQAGLPADKLVEAGRIASFFEQMSKRIDELFKTMDNLSATWSHG